MSEWLTACGIPVQSSISQASMSRGVRWDEDNLAQNEEEKVPRMKIDEPPTPYNYEYQSDEEQPEPVVIDSDIINEALQRREEEVRHDDFAERRKQHYNEFLMVQQYSNQQEEEDDQD